MHDVTTTDLAEFRFRENEMNEFVDYVLNFYGHDKIYDIGVTRKEVIKATKIRMILKSLPFDGDSFDRELVRDIMISMREGVAA